MKTNRLTKKRWWILGVLLFSLIFAAQTLAVGDWGIEPLECTQNEACILTGKISSSSWNHVQVILNDTATTKSTCVAYTPYVEFNTTLTAPEAGTFSADFALWTDASCTAGYQFYDTGLDMVIIAGEVTTLRVPRGPTGGVIIGSPSII